MADKKNSKVYIGLTSDQRQLIDLIIEDKETPHHKVAQFCSAAILDYAKRNHKDYWDLYVKGFSEGQD